MSTTYTARVGRSGVTLFLRVAGGVGALAAAPGIYNRIPQIVVTTTPTLYRGGVSQGQIYGPVTPYWDRLLWVIPQVSAGESLRLTAPDGWASDSNGPLPALDLVVTNGAGQPNPTTFAPGPKILRAGLNLSNTAPYGPGTPFSDLLRGAQGWYDHAVTGDYDALPAPYCDADGRLVKMTPSGAARATVFINEAGYPTPAGPDLGFPAIPSGPVVLTFYGSGATDCVLSPSGSTSAALTGSTDTGTGANRVRTHTYNVTRTGESIGLNLSVVVTATPGADLTGFDATLTYAGSTSGVFNSDYVAQVDGPVVRDLDNSGANNSYAIDESDLPGPDARFCSGVMKKLSAPILTVEPWENDGTAPDGIAPYLLFTTATPHGFRSWQLVEFSAGVPPIATTGASFSVATYKAIAYRVSATTFGVGFNNAGPQAPLAPGVQASGGTAALTHLALWPIETRCSLAAQLPSLKVWWTALPPLLSDAAHAACAARWAANLPAGVKLRVEWGNEVWNNQFRVFYYALYQAQQLGYTDAFPVAWYYMLRTFQVRKIYRDAFTAAGRAGDLVWSVGSQWGGLAYTQALARFVAAHSLDASGNVVPYSADLGPVPVDHLHIAPYVECPAPGPDPVAAFNALGPPGVRDFVQDYLQASGDYTDLLAAHRDAIRAVSPGCVVGGYEGCIERPEAAGDHAGAIGRGWNFEPGSHPVNLQFLQNLEDAGFDDFCWYAHASGVGFYAPDQGPAADADNSLLMPYTVYSGNSMRAGDGAGNGSHPEARLDLMQSVTGYTLQTWQALAAGSVSPASSAAPPLNHYRRRRSA